MREPPSREQGGADDLLAARRSADMPAPGGETLVEHLVDRLARTERELGAARDAAAEDARHRTLLRNVMRQLAAADVALPNLVRPALGVLGEWCLLDQVANGQGERTLITSDPSLDQLAS